MADKSYWFYLESYVYVTVKSNDLLLYNTLTGKFLSYIHKPRLVEFLLRLRGKENLYALEVSDAFIKENGLGEFMDNVLDQCMGGLIDVSLASKKPFIMPLFFDVREQGMRDDGKRSHRTLKNVTGDSLFLLNELTIYVNSRCHNHCRECNSACKQFQWCTVENGGSEISLKEIKELLDQIRGCPIKKINIIGGDLTLYPELDGLMKLLSAGSFQTNVFFHISHLKNGLPSSIRVEGARVNVHVLVDGLSLTKTDELTPLKSIRPDRMIFLIQREEEVSILQRVMDELLAENDFDMSNISVQPYFNGGNIEFFKKNVFTDYEALYESILDIRMINARKSQNTLNYGKLYISSNKNIYSNLNGSPLGKVPGTSMKNAVVSELSEHGNWLRVRADVEPCGDCLLNAICPPLSDFEYASGINNSCNIRQESVSINRKE